MSVLDALVEWSADYIWGWFDDGARREPRQRGTTVFCVVSVGTREPYHAHEWDCIRVNICWAVVLADSFAARSISSRRCGYIFFWCGRRRYIWEGK